MNTILITFTKPVRVGFTNNPDYPLAITVNGGQELLARNMREARIAANGALTALQTVNLHSVIQVDPRLEG